MVGREEGANIKKIAPIFDSVTTVSTHPPPTTAQRGLFKYTGQWESDQQHGQGTCQYADGSVYEGQWHEGARWVHFAAAVWLIPWSHHLHALPLQPPHVPHTLGPPAHPRRQGTGKLAGPGQYRYEGQWRADRQHGPGACYSEAGDKYVGRCRGVWCGLQSSGNRTARGAHTRIQHTQALLMALWRCIHARRSRAGALD